MPHPDIKRLIDESIDGELGHVEQVRLDEHLHGCEECRAYYATAERESAVLQRALQQVQPSADLRAAVMARVTQAPAPAPSSLRRAVVAGIAGNVITALILVVLSLGTQASLWVMVLIAIVGATLWGTVKGLAFGGLVRYLPGNTVLRGLIFGVGIWLLTNALLAMFGGFSASADLAPGFVVTGSLIHDLVYGLLISALYNWFAGEMKWQRVE